MHIFWELRQQGQIRAARKTADSARSTAGDVRAENTELRRQVDKCMLVIESLWTLCRDAHGWTDQQLIDRVVEVDMQDGQLDGKVRKTARPCPQCGKAIAPERSQCMWCGTEDERLFG